MNIAARLRILPWALVALLAALPLLGVRPASAASVAWAGCGDGVQCAALPVPLDYENAGAGTISIAMIKRPAADPAHRIGSLVVNPGGPGESGVDFVRADWSALPAPVRARFDVVGFDPRGVGRSAPVRCFADPAEQSSYLSRLGIAPRTLAEIAQTDAAAAAITALCGRRNAALLPHLSTADVARDMDRIRTALGDPGLTYAGYSYGTYLGATYANLFPDRVRAMVLDGVAEPTAYATGRGVESALWPLWNRLGGDVAAADVMHEFLSLCAGAGPACAFGGGDERATTARWERLLSRLASAPVTWPTPPAPTTLDDRALALFTVTVLYEPLVWPYWAALLDDLDRGAAPSQIDLALLAAIQAPLAPGYDNHAEALWASSCVDSDGPPSAALWPAIGALADARAPHFGALWAYNGLPCATWPARDAGRYTGPWDARTAAPVLLVGTTHDPATGYGNAIRLSQEMPGARLLTVDGWGHTALGAGSTCAGAAEAAYLIDGALPAAGARCGVDRRPFAPTPATDAAAGVHVAGVMRALGS